MSNTSSVSGGWPDGMAVAPVIKKTAKPKFWVKKKYLCMAATRLTDENARQIKKRCIWQWSGDEINVNSITENDRQRYGIPDNDRLIKSIEAYKTEEQIEEMEYYSVGHLQKEIDAVYNCLHDAKLNHHTYYNLINKKYNVAKETCTLFAQRYSVWNFIIENYSRSKNSLTIFFHAYSLVFPEHLSDTNSFSNFKKGCDLKGIEAKIIDGRAINKAAKRITSFQYALLQSLYIQPQKINAPSAHKKLVVACEGLSEQPYSLASVKKYFGEFENNAELFAARYGAGQAQKQLPYASLLPAQHRNTQWQIDGWTMPFWGAQFQRYVLYLIRDNHSRKIVAYSIGESENTTIIMEALEDAMRNTGVFPGELVSDKHSFHQTATAARLRAETERMGAVWSVTINAQRNQLAERYNQYLDALCKEFAGYLGKNMTATSKDARPALEALTELAKTVNFKTIDEIKAIAAYVVNEFNKTPLTALEGISPNDKYEQSQDLKAFKISEDERLKLVRPATAYKVVRGQIIIKVGMKKWEFQLPAELISKYNNREVIAVYEDLAQGIYLSDLKSGEELGCIMPKQKIHGAIPDQTEKDKELINKLTGRNNGVTTTARKTAQAKIAEALKANPEAIDRINHFSLPKDIRALALKDSELKRVLADNGINANSLPIRTQKAQTVSMPAVKTKNTPYAPVGSNMEFVSIEDIIVDRKLLDDLRKEVTQLKTNVRVIKSRVATMVSLVASDGGNNKLVYDPFFFQLVRVVDSNGNKLCLDTISPTTDTDILSGRQFDSAGNPISALGRLMKDLGCSTLNDLSPMIHSGKTLRETPEKVSPSWVQTYRDLCEWAVLYDKICYTRFSTNTLIVRDGLLRSKIFRFKNKRPLFIEMVNRMLEGIDRAWKNDKVKVFLVGLAKHSQVLSRYSLAMQLEDILPKGEPLHARVPLEIEKKSYTWKEFIWHSDENNGEEENPEVNKYSMGHLYLVRFGKLSSDPIWAVDLLPTQSVNDAEIFGYLLQDSIYGFPVPHYPLCLQRAHEHAQIVNFDMDILQDEVIKAIKEILPNEKREIIDHQVFNSDQSQNRYS